MAFIVYKEPYKGHRARVIPRDKALKLAEAMQHPERVTNPEQRAFIANIKQLSIPEQREPVKLIKEHHQSPHSDPTEPIGKDRAAGDT